MGIITAKQIKVKTGEIIKRIQAGERLILTYRGKKIATIEPSSSDDRDEPGVDKSKFEKAWEQIEAKLNQTEPEFRSWQEAIDWARKRS